MPFSVNCTDKPCVYKINSSIQANKNISSTLCLSMERNWACPLQFYYRSSEGQPLEHSYRISPLRFCTCCSSFLSVSFPFPFSASLPPSWVSLAPIQPPGLISRSPPPGRLPRCSKPGFGMPPGGSCCNTSHTVVWTRLWPPACQPGLSIAVFSSVQHSVWYLESTTNIC